MEHKLITELRRLLQENGEANGSYKFVDYVDGTIKEEEVLRIKVKDMSEIIKGIPLGSTKQYTVDLEYKGIKGHTVFTDIEVFFRDLQKDFEKFGL